MIIRSAKIRATWTCHDNKNAKWKYHFVDVTIIQKYTKKEPIEPFNEEGLNTWLDLRAYTTIKAMCVRSCESNCDSCYCTESSIDFDILTVPTQKGELPKPKVPQYILEHIDQLEEQAEQYEEAARLIREEIKRLKEQYGI